MVLAPTAAVAAARGARAVPMVVAAWVVIALIKRRRKVAGQRAVAGPRAEVWPTAHGGRAVSRLRAVAGPRAVAGLRVGSRAKGGDRAIGLTPWKWLNPRAIA